MPAERPKPIRRIMMIVALAVLSLKGNGETSTYDSDRAGTQVTEQGRFLLHKYQALVGEEKYEITREGDSLLLRSNFDLSYLGTKVSLASQVRAAPDWTPRHFELRGDTSTQSHIDLTVDINGLNATVRDDEQVRSVDVPRRFFTADGYAPLAVQQMMARYWMSGGGKTSLATLPGGEVTFERRGDDTIVAAGKPEQLERYSVGGVIWGRETLWFDSAHQLIAAIMVDAEQDHFEAVRDGYESSLKFFVTKAAQDSIALLKKISRGIAPLHKGKFAITGGTLIDVVNKTTIDDSVVVIEGDRIVARDHVRRVRFQQAQASLMREEKPCYRVCGKCTPTMYRSN